MTTRTYSVTLSDQEEALVRAWMQLAGHTDWSMHQAIGYVLGLALGSIASDVIDAEDQQIALGSLEEFDESFPAAPGS